MASNTEWTLRTGSSKKFDEWKFVSPFKDEEPIKVEIRLVSEGGKMSFKAEAWRNRDKLSWSCGDIEELRRMIEHDLHTIVSITSGAVWEDYLEVIVSGQSPGAEIFVDKSAGINVQYKKIRRGTHAAYPGKVFTVSNTGCAHRFPKPKRAGERDEGDNDLGLGLNLRGIGSRNPDHEYSYIPDTPENRESLEKVMRAIAELKGRLADLLQQGQVEASLSEIASGVPALPALTHNSE